MLLVQSSVYSQPVQTLLRFPDTGQTQSYTVTFGEDNDYTINPPGYRVHGNGTVTDTVTGLMWQQTDGGEMSYARAQVYADTLTLGGYTDWRLPTALEAYSIHLLQNANPALNTNVFTKTTAEYWWTSERQANDSTKVYSTNAGGGIGNHRMNETVSSGGTKRYAVRAVRNPVPPIYVTERFVQLPSGVITDSMTGLQWSPQPSTDSLTWEDAITTAESALYGGYSDWRLPNIKELQSLSDLTTVNPVLDKKYFSQIGVRRLWSSTSISNQSQRAWYFDTQYGVTTYTDKVRRLSTILVRSSSIISSVASEDTEVCSLRLNPVNGNFSVYCANGIDNLDVFTIVGEKIRQPLFIMHDVSARLSLPSQGLYLIRILSQGAYCTHKIIVQY
ncbi:MAG: DUF1566 domain-containing protein [Candidatus Kapabacteria bacterium]|nr:DUF1566 domain-containing protein [Candidatus Kapabacteria bacterium]